MCDYKILGDSEVPSWWCDMREADRSSRREGQEMLVEEGLRARLRGFPLELVDTGIS